MHPGSSHRTCRWGCPPRLVRIRRVGTIGGGREMDSVRTEGVRTMDFILALWTRRFEGVLARLVSQTYSGDLGGEMDGARGKNSGLQPRCRTPRVGLGVVSARWRKIFGTCTTRGVPTMMLQLYTPIRRRPRENLRCLLRPRTAVWRV